MGSGAWPGPLGSGWPRAPPAPLPAAGQKPPPAAARRTRVSKGVAANGTLVLRALLQPCGGVHVPDRVLALVSPGAQEPGPLHALMRSTPRRSVAPNPANAPPPSRCGCCGGGAAPSGPWLCRLSHEPEEALRVPLPPWPSIMRSCEPLKRPPVSLGLVGGWHSGGGSGGGVHSLLQHNLGLGVRHWRDGARAAVLGGYLRQGLAAGVRSAG